MSIERYFGVKDEYLDRGRDTFFILKQITNTGDRLLYLTTKGLRWLKSLFCFPKEGLLQALTKKSDTQLLDTYNKGDAREVQQSRAYEFNGSNYLQFGAGFNVGDTLTYTKTDNTTDTVVLDANKRAFDGVAIRIFNYEINSYIFNCEEKAGNTSYSTTTGVTADIYGSLTGFHVIDHRKTTCFMDSIGFAFKDYFEFNGINNTITNTDKLGLDFEVETISRRLISKSYNILIDAYIGGNNGYYFGYTTGYLIFKYGDGSNFNQIATSIDTDFHLIKYGISGNTMYIDVDGIRTNADISTITKSDFTIKRLFDLTVISGGEFDGSCVYLKTADGTIDYTFNASFTGIIEGTVLDSQWGYNRAIPIGTDGTPVASYDTWYKGIVPKNVDFVNATELVCNGTDTDVNTKRYLVGKKPIYIETALTTTTIVNNEGIYDCDGNTTKGISAFINANLLVLQFRDNGSNVTNVITGHSLIDNTDYLIKFTGTGVATEDFTIEVNGVIETYQTPYDWDGNSSEPLHIAQKGVGKSNSKFKYFKFTNNGKTSYIPFSNISNNAYDTEQNLILPISGTVGESTHDQDNQTIFINQNNGFNIRSEVMFNNPDDFTLSNWVVTSGTIDNANTVTLNAGARFGQSPPKLIPQAGTKYKVSAKVTLLSGNGEFKFRLNGGTDGALHTATSTEILFEDEIYGNGSSGITGIYKATATGQLRITDFKIDNLEQYPASTANYNTAIIDTDTQRVYSEPISNIGNKFSFYCEIMNHNYPQDVSGNADNEIFSLFDETETNSVAYLLVESNTTTNNDGAYGFGVRANDLSNSGVHTSSSKMRVGKLDKILCTVDNSVSGTTVIKIYKDGEYIEGATVSKDLYLPTNQIAVLGAKFGGNQNANVNYDVNKIQVFDKVLLWNDIVNENPIIEYNFENNLNDSKGLADLVNGSTLSFNTLTNLDIYGYSLSNPPCEIGSNDGSQKQYPLEADLIHADTDEIYFDKTTPELVVARELDNVDLPLVSDYTRWNAVENCKMQGLIYDHNLTTEEDENITTCYAKKQTGTVAQFNNGNVIQFNDGNIMEFNN